MAEDVFNRESQGASVPVGGLLSTICGLFGIVVGIVIASTFPVGIYLSWRYGDDGNMDAHIAAVMGPIMDGVDVLAGVAVAACGIVLAAAFVSKGVRCRMGRA